MGCRPARIAGAHPRRESAGFDPRPLPCIGRRHPGARASRASPPCHPEFLCGIRTRVRRQPCRTAARSRPSSHQRNVGMPRTSTSRDLRFLDPAVIGRLGTMELKARTVVEGFLSGLHRSPYKGFSVEFAEYRQYLPGDDLSTLDWKVFARSDRYYVKKFEEETNLECHLLLDVSASMAYKGSAPISKLEYGSVLAASLAYLMNRQRDATGLIAFDERILTRLPARARPGHLHTILMTLERLTPGARSDVSRPLHQLADALAKRSLVVLISDLLDDPD